MAQFSQDSSTQPARLVLTGSLTIYEVRETHAALLEALGDPEPGRYQLDLGDLEEIDTAGAQLLLAVQRHLHQAGAQLQVLNPSPAVLELFELLRLKTLYPDVLPAQG